MWCSAVTPVFWYLSPTTNNIGSSAEKGFAPDRPELSNRVPKLLNRPTRSELMAAPVAPKLPANAIVGPYSHFRHGRPVTVSGDGAT